MDLSFGHQALIIVLALGVVLPLAQWLISEISTPPLSAGEIDPTLVHAVFCLIAAVVIPVVTIVTTSMTHVAGGILFVLIVIAGLLTAGDLGPTHSLLIGSTVSGFIMAHVMARGVREIPMHVIGTTALVVISLGTALLIGAVKGEDMWQRMNEIPTHIIQKSFEAQIAAQETMEGTPIRLTPRERARAMELSAWLLPGRALVFQFFALFLALRLVRRVLPSGAGKMQPLWSLGGGDLMAGLVVFFGLGTLVCSEMEWGIAERVADNALLVLYHMLWAIGLSILHCVMLQLRLSTPLRIWGWAMVILLSTYGLTSVMRILLAALGLFDVWFNFRRRSARWVANRRQGPKR